MDEKEGLPKEIIDTNVSTRIAACLARIEKERNNICPTHFQNLDNALVGGLSGGRLYMISSISSLVRTTFVLNIANKVAYLGRKVLFYSLEISSDELMLKSLINEMNSRGTALTYADIVLAEDPYTFSNVSSRLKSFAKDYYDNVGKNICIQDGRHIIGDKDLIDVLPNLKSSLEKFSKDNCKSLIIVDYLELLPYYSGGHFSYEQSIYENVYALKRIAVKYNVPVIVVSSSSIGSIDYGADVVLRLQQLAVNCNKVERPKLPNEAKSKYPREVREVELEIIKDKMFGFGGKICFDYYPQHNYFKEKKRKRSLII
jgi:replicative DNA helicase